MSLSVYFVYKVKPCIVSGGYADAAMEDITGEVISEDEKKATTGRLEIIVELAARMVLLCVIEEIISSSENANVKIDLTANGMYAIGWARASDHTGIVRFLLGKVNDISEGMYRENISPADKYDAVLKLAAGYGHIGVTKSLFAEKEEKHDLYESIDPAADDNRAIRWTTEYGHVEVIKFLLAKKEERSGLYRGIDPAADDNYAIRRVAQN
jgi:hypothetical protein